MGGVLEICSAGMWPTKRGEGASPSHLSCISPLIQQQPLNLIFQHFSPWALCSVFSCGMCCRTQLIVKTFNLWSCFSLPLPFFSLPIAQTTTERSHKAGASVQSDLHHSKVPAVGDKNRWLESYYLSVWWNVAHKMRKV